MKIYPLKILQALRNQSLQGLFRLDLVSGTASSFGWTDIALLEAAPFASARGGTAMWPSAGSSLRGIYKFGVGDSNDASGDPSGFPGNAFTCSCADKVPSSNVSEESITGVLSEAEGIYTHDDIHCSWAFEGHNWSAVQFQCSVTTALDTRFEHLSISSFGPAGDCYPKPCIPTAASFDKIATSVPSAVLYSANSSRFLGSRPPGFGGRFSISFVQDPSERRTTQSQLFTSGNGNGTTFVGRQYDSTVNGPAAGTLILSVTGEPGMQTPCSFHEDHQRLILHLRPSSPIQTILEGLWNGFTSAAVAPDGAALFELAGAGYCDPTGGNMIAQYSSANNESCATLCITNNLCGYISFALGECLLFSSCRVLVTECSSAKKKCNASTYSTFRQRTDLVTSNCSAAMIMRGLSIRLFVHACKSRSAVAGERQSPEIGMLHGLLQPGENTGCDIAAVEQPPPCVALVKSQNANEERQVEYWTGRVRWSASSRNRAVGDVDYLMITMNGTEEPNSPLTMVLVLAPDRLPPPDLVFGNESAILNPQNPNIFTFWNVGSNISNANFIGPAKKVKAVPELGICSAALARIQTSNIVASRATCARAVALLFPPSNIPYSSLDFSEYPNIAGNCSNDCLGELTSMIDIAVQNCSAAWLSTPIVPVLVNGVPVLDNSNQLLTQFSALLSLSNALFQLSSMCATNRNGQACSRGAGSYIAGKCPTLIPQGFDETAADILVLIEGVGSCSATQLNGMCASGIDDYIFNEGCCAATIAAALQRWNSDLISHRSLTPHFLVEWGNGRVQEFRAAQACLEGVVLLGSWPIDVECWVDQCSPAGEWPEACCNSAVCVNGKKDYAGACSCACQAGWTGRLCDKHGPHVLATLSLGGLSIRTWLLGGQVKFTSIIISLIAESSSVEVNEVSESENRRSGSDSSLVIEFRALVKSPAEGQQAAGTLVRTVDSHVLGDVMTGAGLGSGIAALVVIPSVYDGNGQRVCYPACNYSNVSNIVLSSTPINILTPVAIFALVGSTVLCTGLLAYQFRDFLQRRYLFCQELLAQKLHMYYRRWIVHNIKLKFKVSPVQGQFVLMDGPHPIDQANTHKHEQHNSDSGKQDAKEAELTLRRQASEFPGEVKNQLIAAAIAAASRASKAEENAKDWVQDFPVEDWMSHTASLTISDEQMSLETASVLRGSKLSRSLSRLRRAEHKSFSKVAPALAGDCWALQPSKLEDEEGDFADEIGHAPSFFDAASLSAISCNLAPSVAVSTVSSPLEQLLARSSTYARSQSRPVLEQECMLEDISVRPSGAGRRSRSRPPQKLGNAENRPEGEDQDTDSVRNRFREIPLHQSSGHFQSLDPFCQSVQQSTVSRDNEFAAAILSSYSTRAFVEIKTPVNRQHVLDSAMPSTLLQPHAGAAKNLPFGTPSQQPTKQLSAFIAESLVGQDRIPAWIVEDTAFEPGEPVLAGINETDTYADQQHLKSLKAAPDFCQDLHQEVNTELAIGCISPRLFHVRAGTLLVQSEDPYEAPSSALADNAEGIVGLDRKAVSEVWCAESYVVGVDLGLSRTIAELQQAGQSGQSLVGHGSPQPRNRGSNLTTSRQTRLPPLLV